MALAPGAKLGPHEIGAPVVLRPTNRDAFMMPRGSASIRFLRDSAGNVTGLSAGDNRAWDLHAREVRPSASRVSLVGSKGADLLSVGEVCTRGDSLVRLLGLPHSSWVAPS